jgi:hypothetical protein
MELIYGSCSQHTDNEKSYEINGLWILLLCIIDHYISEGKEGIYCHLLH